MLLILDSPNASETPRQASTFLIEMAKILLELRDMLRLIPTWESSKRVETISSHLVTFCSIMLKAHFHGKASPQEQKKRSTKKLETKNLAPRLNSFAKIYLKKSVFILVIADRSNSRKNPTWDICESYSKTYFTGWDTNMTTFSTG